MDLGGDSALAVAGRVVACANQKGGVGKTTTVVNLATALALGGCDVAVVDLDPQGNATSGLGIDRAEGGPSLYDVLAGEETILQAVRPTVVPRLALVVSSLALAGLEIELVPLERRERRLAGAIEPLREQFRYTFIDCPPSLGLLTINALVAADTVLVPVQCEYYALEGLSQLLATVGLVRDHLNPRLRIEGALLTMYDSRTRLAADVEREVRRHMGAAVFKTRIPRSVRLSEAPSYGRPAALYRPDSKGAEAYADLGRELLARPRGGERAASEAVPV